MRKSHVCPKCHHNRILLIDSVPDMGEVSTEIRRLHVAKVRTGESYFGNERATAAGALTAATCRSCGYTEFYAEDPGSIPIDGKYVREVVGPEQKAPHR
jgi:predicted nucleic-acid-binding Zn-ribbon protein